MEHGQATLRLLASLRMLQAAIPACFLVLHTSLYSPCSLYLEASHSCAWTMNTTSLTILRTQRVAKQSSDIMCAFLSLFEV